MAFFDDYSLTRNGANYDLRHVSGTTRYSVLEAYRAIQALGDDGTFQGDDENDILQNNLATRQTDQAITFINGMNIDDASAQFIFGGSITQLGGDERYSGIDLQFLVTPFTANVYMDQDGTRVDLPVPTGNSVTDSLSFLVKVREAGADIASGDLRFYTRDLGNVYSDLAVNVAAGGQTTVFLGPGQDSNVNAADGAIYAAILADLTIELGSFTDDANNGNGVQNYDVRVTVGNSRTPAEVYQALQYLTRDGSTDTVDTGEAGQFYRLADPGYTPIPGSPLATFAGGSITGAQGVFFDGFDAEFAQNFIGRDDANTAQTPPNTVPVSMTGVVTNDRIGIFRTATLGGPIMTDEFSIAAGNDTGDTEIVVNEVISPDHPTSGVIRVLDGGRFVVFPYSSFDGSAFTLVTPLDRDLDEDADAFVPFIDESAASDGTSSVTIIQSAPIFVLSRLRNGDANIVPFQVPGTIGASGISVSAIRNSDA